MLVKKFAYVIFFLYIRGKFREMNKAVKWIVLGGVGWWLFDMFGKQAIAAYNLGFRLNDVRYKGRGNIATSLKFELLIDVSNTSIFDIYVDKFELDVLFNHNSISKINKEQHTLFQGKTITTIPIIIDIDIKTTWDTLLSQIQSGYFDNWLFEVKGNLYTKNITVPLNVEFNFQDFQKLLFS